MTTPSSYLQVQDDSVDTQLVVRISPNVFDTNVAFFRTLSWWSLVEFFFGGQLVLKLFHIGIIQWVPGSQLRDLPSFFATFDGGVGREVNRVAFVLVRITVRIITWASEKDITNVQRMRITRSFRWLELLKCETYEISARDLWKPFREIKNKNSFLWTNTGVTNMLSLPHDKVFVHLRNPVKK